MADVLNIIDSISAKLELALIAQDWEAVKQLDEQLRAYFDQIEKRRSIEENQSPDSQDMIVVMQNLSKTYQKVLQACEQHRSQIQQEMAGLRQGRKGVRAYQGL